jgi:hypothetical protein
MEEQYVSVFEAPDEGTANMVKVALEDAGIEAIVHDMWGTMNFDGAIALAEGRWGDVLVKPEDAERAAELLRQYESGGSGAPEEEVS